MKHALITGGNHGIGLAIAKKLVADGCKVAVCSRFKEATLNALAGTGILWYHCDVQSEYDIKRTISDIVDEWGCLDILVNNVGGGGRWGKYDPCETSEDVWKEVYQKNAGAATLFTMQAIPLMRLNKWGRVVTITSIYGGKESGGRSWFEMAKAAQVALMKSLSKHKPYVRDGITFNSIAPGYIEIDGKPEYEGVDNLPLGRMGKPEEVANVVSFLCSEGASLVNGAQIVVDGGESHAF